MEITGSTYTDDEDAATEVLSAKIKEVHEAVTFGIRKKYLFKEAVLEYLEQIEEKIIHNPNTYSSLPDMKRELRLAVKYLGNNYLHNIHDGNHNLRRLISDRKIQGVKNKTVNDALDMINRVLSKATSWRDSNGITWLDTKQSLTLLDRNADSGEPYPLTWKEQKVFKSFFHSNSVIPDMIDFLVNTGAREQEACALQWEWEHYVTGLNVSVFVVPNEYVKNRIERIL